MERTPIGLVGCGGMGLRHIAGFGVLADTGRSPVDVVSVCDLREDLALRAADLVEQACGRRPAVFSSLDKAIDDPNVAAFDVVTDASSHHAVAAPILRAGKHVLCEKPLGITIRSARAIIDAADSSGAVLGVAENYRRDPVNRLARAVIDAGLLGNVHLLIQQSIGGGRGILGTPWRHLKERGAIGLDQGTHFTDIIQYLLGEIKAVSGRGLIAEPVRYPASPTADAEPVKATGEDSVIAVYRSTAGASAQLSWLPSGPAYRFWQRSVHGTDGALEVPRDRSGGPVTLHVGDRTLTGPDLLAEVPDFSLDSLTRELFVFDEATYDLPAARVDAALIAIEVADFAEAIAEGRQPEVDGGAGIGAIAAVLGAYESDLVRRDVLMDDVVNGSVSAYQDEIDVALGHIDAHQATGDVR